jgi:hypothetical protein
MTCRMIGSLTRKMPPPGGSLIDPIAPLLVTFQPNTPYDPKGMTPQQIRADFEEVLNTHEPWAMLYRLASYLPSATLAEFMDDFAMGRI